jgi:thymidine phosphorylase
METLAPVELTTREMRRVVDAEGGCIVWGGAIRLSPADDVLIGVERALDLDSEGQLVASVLSKKAAAGSTHVVIDLPVGPTAKVRGAAQAQRLARTIDEVARGVGLVVRVLLSDGTQPVGRAIGPALEARDACAVLRRDAGAPKDLEERGVTIAAEVLSLASGAPPDEARAQARGLLDSGRAWRKFQAICAAQGGMREPRVAHHRTEVRAERAGIVTAIDNRRLSRVAKLAGAPLDKAAGLELHARVGTRVEPGQPLFTVHAESPGELSYALDYARGQVDIVRIGEIGEPT